MEKKFPPTTSNYWFILNSLTILNESSKKTIKKLLWYGMLPSKKVPGHRVK